MCPDLAEKVVRKYTTKQMGDACEMLVAAELTLAGVPAIKLPNNWPGYDVIAQSPSRPLQRVPVRSGTFKRGAAFVWYDENEKFDWFAVVLLPDVVTQKGRRIYIIPPAVTDRKARRGGLKGMYPGDRYWRIDDVPRIFESFENNFLLEDRQLTATAKDSRA
jgi:hypothetical protein